MHHNQALSVTVYVIDDDRSVRAMISRMVADVGEGAASCAPHPFAGAQDFLDALDDLRSGCILLDLRMPDLDGFSLLAELARRDVDWPVVVMTGASDVASAVRAMKLGAIDYLEKPIRIDALEASLASAAKVLEQRLAAGERRRLARARIDQLSNRELEVLMGLMGGSSNKQLAHSLGIGLRTVEMHRGNMMDRLATTSLAEAVALAIEAGLRGPDQQDAA